MYGGAFFFLHASYHMHVDFSEKLAYSDIIASDI